MFWPAVAATLAVFGWHGCSVFKKDCIQEIPFWWLPISVIGLSMCFWGIENLVLNSPTLFHGCQYAATWHQARRSVATFFLDMREARSASFCQRHGGISRHWREKNETMER